MEYPYLGFKNADGSSTLSQNSVIVFFTSENKGVVVHNINNGDGMPFGKNGSFNEDEFEFYPEKNVVRLQN